MTTLARLHEALSALCRRGLFPGFALVAICAASVGSAFAACPNPESAQSAPVVQMFMDHLRQHYPMLRDDPSLSMEDRLILIGHALGRQALAVGDDPDRKAAFDCLQVALEQNEAWPMILGRPVRGRTGVPEYFHTIYASAMGMHDDRVAALAGYTAATPLPTVFGDPPMAADDRPAARGDAAGATPQTAASDVEISSTWIDQHRDQLLADGFGPFNGPEGGQWAPDRAPDYLFTVVPWPHVQCWSFSNGVWCHATSTWGSVGVTDGDGWANAPLTGEPSCTFRTDWRETDEDGRHRFGGGMTCPDGRESAWHVVVNK